jgi:hypothetical protein
MGCPWLESSWAPVLLLALLVACSAQPPLSPRDAADASDTGGTLRANNENERTLLKEVSVLPSGSARHVGDATVVAEPAYVSASGRTCRALNVTPGQTGETSHRLACNDGQIWFFVPDVFGSAK